MKSNGLLDDHKNTVHLFNMKTTLEIPGTIYRRVKAHVAAQGQSVKGFVNEAVQEKLGRERAEAGDSKGWRSVFGKASANSVAKVQERIDAEFSRVDPEDWR